MSQRRNVNKMMQQVQQMQQQMQQAQEELARETVTASAGGGAVKATMTGGLELVSIEIDPDVVDPEDVEMLQDMVQAAVNGALASAQELASRKLGGITGLINDEDAVSPRPTAVLDSVAELGEWLAEQD